MALRRGFKSEASTIARETRAELGIGQLNRLDPFVLAKHLGIPIWPLSDFLKDCPGVDHLLQVETGVLSAMTVFCGPSRTIVHNDSHPPGRRSNNLCHELAHSLLFHPRTPALDNKGCRKWNQDIEDEANWLSGELLVTKESAMQVAMRRWSLSEGCERLGVSEQMLRYRIRISGADKIANRFVQKAS
jgi:IrrE N-terminal-like domain